MTVQLGRLWAKGRRFRRGDPAVDVEEVLVVLGDRESLARKLLSRAVRAKGAAGVLVRPEEAETARILAERGVVRLEEKVEGTVIDFRWVPWRVVVPADITDEVTYALGWADPVTERANLLTSVDNEPLLEAEVVALASEDPEAPLRGPRGSALEGVSWSVYAAAMQAASVWARVEREGERLSSRELAARSLGWSKGWTPARKRAFATLVGRPFPEAVTDAERFLRVSGPFRWSVDGIEGDARSGDPWVGLPERGVSQLKILEVGGNGVLVVENLETFEEVVRRDAAPGWVSVFGAGYLSDARVALVDRLALPVVVWCDLDPHGVRIASDLERRLGRTISSVAMGPDLLDSPYSVGASGEQVTDALHAAKQLKRPWSAIAAEIAAKERVCEQEALHAEVLGSLPRALETLTTAHL